MTSATETAATAVSTIQANMKEATEQGYAKVAAGMEQTQAQLKGQIEKAMKKAEEVATFNQGTIDAMMKSGQIWAAGVQDISKQFAATAQTQLGETLSTFKTLTGMRSLKDMMDLQASFARSSVESAMTHTSHLTDASFKLAEQTMAPLTERVSLAVETFAKAG
jgi:phasin family protein